MNNLKRIFSLALATVMVLGMMVVGASAANFTDNEDITHEAAADVMNALGIIGGYEDGSFRPNGDVTRAEMAKMLSVALNGGKDPNVGLPTTMPYSDVKTTDWFAEYVMYCSNLGIIGGRGDGSFDPYGKVTAAEAAKMMLVALGFEAEVFELVGANWSANTMRLATTLLVGDTVKTAKPLSLFSGMSSITANQPLNRDQAAQLIYNGIQSNTVKMALTGVTGSGTSGVIGETSNNRPVYEWSLTGDSLLKSKFGATVTTGIMEEATIAPATNTAPLTGTYKVKYVTGTDNDGKPTTATLSFTTDTDVSGLFQQNVRVIYTGKGVNKNVLAVTSASDDVLSNGAWGGLEQGTAKDKDGNTIVTRLDSYSVEKDGVTDATKVPVYNMVTLKQENTKNITNWNAFCDEYKLIDNDGDEVIDAILITPVTIATVKTMNNKTMTLTNKIPAAGSTSITLAADEVEAGLAKGDYVTVTDSAAGTKTVKKAETMTGLVDATRTNGTVTTLRVAGKWYTVESSFAAEAVKLNKYECNLVLVAGFIVAGAAVEETVELSDAVMVVTVAGQTGSTGGNVDVNAANYLQIRVLKDDGSTQVMNIIGMRNTAVDADGKAVAYTPIDKATDIKIGEVYTYAEASTEGFYNLTKYTGEGYTSAMVNPGDITVSKGVAKQGTLTYRFDKDATVFVLAGTAGANGAHAYAVLKGSDVNAWGSTSYTAEANSALYGAQYANGFTYTQLGFLTLKDEVRIPGMGSTTSEGYGIVTANAARVWDSTNRQYVLNLTIWNGEEEIEVLTTEAKDNDDTKTFTAGTVVKYTDNNNGTITGLTSVEDKLDAVTAYDDNATIKLASGGGKEYTIDKDTHIVYVDRANKTGAADGSIALATPAEDAKGDQIGYYGNVWVEAAANKDGIWIVEYMIVDVSDANVGVADAIK